MQFSTLTDSLRRGSPSFFSQKVRPYLIDDGGDVEVVNVEDGVVSLKLQVSASSTEWMQGVIHHSMWHDCLKLALQLQASLQPF